MVADLISKMIRYNPKKRTSLYKAMCHPFFNELREQDTYLPTGNCLPDLFDFSPEEMQEMKGECRDILIPSWYDPHTTPQLHTVDQSTLRLYDEFEEGAEKKHH